MNDSSSVVEQWYSMYVHALIYIESETMIKLSALWTHVKLFGTLLSVTKKK